MRISLWVGLLVVCIFHVPQLVGTSGVGQLDGDDIPPTLTAERNDKSKKPDRPVLRSVCLWDHKDMESEGVLWVREKWGPITSLTADQKVVVARSRYSLTGASIYLNGISYAFDVYLPDDQLKKLAKELNGQRVVISGEGRRLLVIPAEFGDLNEGTEVHVGKGRTLWFPDTEFREMPTMRFLIWAKDIKRLGAKLPPLLGEPASNKVFRMDWTTYTYQRLPKSNEVTAFRIESDTVHGKTPKVPLTAATFPALLDSMKPVRADDENYRLWHYGHGSEGDFETAEGKFHFYLYPGGLARLHAPDGRIGFVTFVRDE